MSENDNPIGIGNFKPKQAVGRQFSQAPRRLPSKKLIGRSMSARPRPRPKLNFDLPPTPTINQQVINLPSEAGLKDHTEITVPGTGQKLNISIDTVSEVKTLGQGGYGVVSLYKHNDTNYHFAIKRINLADNHSNESKKILERTLRDIFVPQQSTSCLFTVHYLGSMYFDGSIWICMENLSCSLTDFYEKAFGLGEYSHLGNFYSSVKFVEDIGCNYFTSGMTPEPFLLRMIYCLVSALTHIKEKLNIIHRDIKPSNILIDHKRAEKGFIVFKLCDFGISGELSNSIADTNVGCEKYMPPEKIQGQPYSVKSDVWSLALTIIESATGQHPYKNWLQLNMISRCNLIIDEKSPVLHPSYSQQLRNLVDKCLEKDPEKRPDYQELKRMDIFEKYSDDSYLKSGQDSVDFPRFDLELFINAVLGRNTTN